MRTINFDFETLRVVLHILAVCVWVGGQVVLIGAVLALRKTQPQVIDALVRSFGRVVWPFFGLAIFTGVWSMTSLTSTSVAWNALFGIKILSVTLSGVTAWLFQTASNSAVKAMAGALALASSIAALITGVTLSG